MIKYLPREVVQQTPPYTRHTCQHHSLSCHCRSFIVDIIIVDPLVPNPQSPSSSPSSIHQRVNRSLKCSSVLVDLPAKLPGDWFPHTVVYRLIHITRSVVCFGDVHFLPATEAQTSYSTQGSQALTPLPRSYVSSQNWCYAGHASSWQGWTLGATGHLLAVRLWI